MMQLLRRHGIQMRPYVCTDSHQEHGNREPLCALSCIVLIDLRQSGRQVEDRRDIAQPNTCRPTRQHISCRDEASGLAGLNHDTGT